MRASSWNPGPVAFQGNRGAYSEAASKSYFGDGIDLLPCHSFDDVFERVIRGDAGAGVLPIENSLTGSIHRNYDLLLKFNVWIVGEAYVRVMHSLIVHPGTTLEEIKKVYSHPQGLSQCEKFLAQYPHWELVPAYDTAGSVQIIKEEKLKDAAAIASRHAADFYGMAVLKEGIEDIEENFTRFIVIRKDKAVFPDADMTSIVFSTSNVPGALFKSLSVFALRDIGLSKIESPPLHGKPWQYFFYLDIEDNIENKRCERAINHLQEITDFFKVLGCYRRGNK